VRRAFAALLLLSASAGGQDPRPPAFDVASLKPSARTVGPDANNSFAFVRSGITGSNVTLRRLIAEAYGLQLRQVLGPPWLDQNEYDLEARAPAPAPRGQLALMLRALLAERFRLTQHRETRDLRVYVLTVGRGGARIDAVEDGATPTVASFPRFHGSMQRFADLLAVQLSIPVLDDPTRPARASGPPVPVLDRTGLTGVYDLVADVKPEPGADMFTLWQRVLRDRMGLQLESRKEAVEVLVVDAADRLPAAN
jgi:uncharacterized protein (TIGR03435 family)